MTSAEKIVYLLKDLFACGDIALIGQHNSNGADSYYCTSCGAREDMMGHANMSAPLSEIKHEDSCQLMELYKRCQEQEDANE